MNRIWVIFTYITYIHKHIYIYLSDGLVHRWKMSEHHMTEWLRMNGFLIQMWLYSDIYWPSWDNTSNHTCEMSNWSKRWWVWPFAYQANELSVTSYYLNKSNTFCLFPTAKKCRGGKSWAGDLRGQTVLQCWWLLCVRILTILYCWLSVERVDQQKTCLAFYFFPP